MGGAEHAPRDQVGAVLEPGVLDFGEALAVQVCPLFAPEVERPHLERERGGGGQEFGGERQSVNGERERHGVMQPAG